MKIKKYEAVDMQDALKLIKSDLGPEAVILTTKKFKKGGTRFGLFGRQLIEVTAAVDEDMIRNINKNGNINDSRKHYGKDPLFDSLQSELSEMKEILHSLSQKEKIYESEGGHQDIQNIREELNHFSKLVCSFLEKKDISSRNNIEMYKKLVVNEVDEKLAIELIHNASKKSEKKKMKNNRYFEAILAKNMMEMLRVSGSIKSDKNQRKIVFLVGPTGVGKTTTISKLAAVYSMMKGKKVVLSTIDTYRIGAAEQLKTYADIIGLSADVITGLNNFKDFIQRNNDKELILVDTIGGNLMDPFQFNEIKSRYNNGTSVETHLVLNANTKDGDLRNTIKKYSVIPIDRLLFTKLDESSTYGSIFNQSVYSDIPVSYLTTGQKIPEDIEVAIPERIVDLILHISKN